MACFLALEENVKIYKNKSKKSFFMENNIYKGAVSVSLTKLHFNVIILVSDF